MGNLEIKTSNKTKEEIQCSIRIFLRVTTPPRACEPVLEVETDLADSGAHSGPVGNSWLVIFANGELPYFSKSKSLRNGLSTLM